MKEVYTIEDCIVGSGVNDNFEGKVIVIRDTEYNERYRDKKYQLHLATGGFGCDPTKIGRAVFTHNLYDDEQVRWNREQFLGVLKPELLPDWAKESLEKLKAKGAKVNA